MTYQQLLNAVRQAERWADERREWMLTVAHSSILDDNQDEAREAIQNIDMLMSQDIGQPC